MKQSEKTKKALKAKKPAEAGFKDRAGTERALLKGADSGLAQQFAEGDGRAADSTNIHNLRTRTRPS
jgi:hypothetical protein